LIAPPSATATHTYTYCIQCGGSPIWKYSDLRKITVPQGQKVELFSNKNFQRDTEVECYLKNDNYGASKTGLAIVEIEER